MRNLARSIIECIREQGGGLWTWYGVSLSGNQMFPGGGEMGTVQASSPEEAARLALPKSPFSWMSEYATGEGATVKELEGGYEVVDVGGADFGDEGTIVIAPGRRSKTLMTGLANSIFPGPVEAASRYIHKKRFGGGDVNFYGPGWYLVRKDDESIVSGPHLGFGPGVEGDEEAARSALQKRKDRSEIKMQQLSGIGGLAMEPVDNA